MEQSSIKRKDTLKTRLIKDYVKVSKNALREPKSWREVATRVRWERLNKILRKRYDYLPQL